MPSVRDLGLPDLDALLGLYRHLHTEDDPLPDRSTVEQIWNDLCASPLHLYLGVESAGELVSTCAATIVPNLTRGARPYAVIENVVTHPDYRRRGLGAAVVTEALRRCWAVGCYKVMLLSGREREDVHAFYEKLGFDKHAKQGFLARPR